MNKKTNKIKTTYYMTSIIFFNTLVFFSLLNIIAWFCLQLDCISNRNKVLIKNAINYKCYFNKNLNVYTNQTYVNEVIDDFCNSMKQTGSEYTYYPVVEYCQKKFKSKHLNIINDGNFAHRSSIRGGGGRFHIFCFGGSTTYGSFVSDEHTWPSFLMQNLNSNIENRKFTCINYGNSGYTPSQETYQFIQLLKMGYRPSAVIFLDGVNTGPIYDGSEFSKNIAEKFQYDENGNNIGIRILIQLPITRLIFTMLNNNNLLHNDDTDIFPLEYSKKYNYLITNRFILNAKIRLQIAKMYDIPILQFLQPNVFIDYNSNFLSPLLKIKYNEDTLKKPNYQELYSKILSSECGFTDLSGLFKSYPYPALIDGVHYSPDFNKYLSDSISHYIHNLKLKPYTFQSLNSTGIPFKTD